MGGARGEWEGFRSGDSKILVSIERHGLLLDWLLDVILLIRLLKSLSTDMSRILS